MSLISKIIGVSFLTISSCAPQKRYEENPNPYPVPLFYAPPEEAHPDCKTETVKCNCYSDYGTVLVFKCQNAEKQTLIYVSEKNRFNRKLWYKKAMPQDINNQTFSEYCKSTFENYKQFMQETGYEKQ